MLMHDSGSLCKTTTCIHPPAVVDALSDDPRASEGQSMQDLASERPRIYLPRTPVNRERRRAEVL